MSEILAFNKWDCSNIKVEDPGLKKYINLDAVIVPKTGARYAGNRFHKSKIFIVERLINKLMVPGHRSRKHKITSGFCTGKAVTVYNLVYKALEIIEKKLNKNPVEVLVKAIENAAPREEIITIEYGGARYPKPVESAPQRRVDIVLKFIAQGAYQKAFSSKKPAENCIADEIMNAYNFSQSSAGIAKKLEVERQADASR
jgi:small subunit ribosomal protein S7